VTYYICIYRIYKGITATDRPKRVGETELDTMERRKAREAVMELLFEHEFKKDENPTDAVRMAEECREAETDAYVEKVYFGVLDHLEELDGYLTARAIGWKTNRMTKISLTLMRIATYEMKYCDDIPFTVSINEAVELSKKFDDDKAPAFVNGVLNGVAEDLGLKGTGNA